MNDWNPSRVLVRTVRLPDAGLEAALELYPASLATAKYRLPAKVSERLLHTFDSTQLSPREAAGLALHLSGDALDRFIAKERRVEPLVFAARSLVARPEVAVPEGMVDRLVRRSGAHPDVATWLWRYGYEVSSETVDWYVDRESKKTADKSMCVRTAAPMAILSRRSASPTQLLQLLGAQLKSRNSAHEYARAWAAGEVLADSDLLSYLAAELSPANRVINVIDHRLLLNSIAWSSDPLAGEVLTRFFDLPVPRGDESRVAHVALEASRNPALDPSLVDSLSARFEIELPHSDPGPGRTELFELLTGQRTAAPTPAALEVAVAYAKTWHRESRVLHGREWAIPLASDLLALLGSHLPKEMLTSELKAQLYQVAEGMVFPGSTGSRATYAMIRRVIGPRWVLRPLGFSFTDEGSYLGEDATPLDSELASALATVAPSLEGVNEWRNFLRLYEQGLNFEEAALIAADSE